MNNNLDKLSTEVLADYPAYSIHKPRVYAFRGMPVIRSNRNIMVNMGGRVPWTEFSPGSVASYAIENDDDPVAAIERAKELGHKLKWINGCAVSISTMNSPKEYFEGFELGDKVWFEGEAFTLERDWNSNVKLVPAEADEAAA